MGLKKKIQNVLSGLK